MTEQTTNSELVQARITSLRRRQKFLEQRIQGTDHEASHYDRAELDALTWAIESLTRGNDERS